MHSLGAVSDTTAAGVSPVPCTSPRSTCQPDGTSTDTTGTALPARAATRAANGSRGGPSKEKPNKASTTTSYPSNGVPPGGGGTSAVTGTSASSHCWTRFVNSCPALRFGYTAWTV